MKNKEKQKDLILKISQTLALFGIFISSYSGLVYICKGNILYSAVLAAILTFILGALIYALTYQKTKKINTGLSKPEIILILIYCVTAFFSFLLISHHLNVENYARKQIQDSGIIKLKELNRMVENYPDSIKAQFSTKKKELTICIDKYDIHKDINKLNNCLNSYGIQNVSSRRRAVGEISKQYEANLDRAQTGHNELVKSTDSFVKQTTKTLTKWDKSQIHNVFHKIQIQVENTYEILDEMHSKGAKPFWVLDAYNFPISKRVDDIISSPRLLKQQYKPSPIGPVLLCLLLHILVLLPYFLINRGKIKYPRPIKSKHKPGRPIQEA